jgi:hypothetical protein
MNIAIWIVAGILSIVAIYMKFFASGKTICKVVIFEEDGGKIIQHTTAYNGVVREATNQSKTKKLRWLFITGIKKNFIIPQSKYFTFTTGKINKTLYLLWNGKDSFKIIKPKLNKFKYQAEMVNGSKYFKSVPMQHVQFNMTDDDWEHMESELKDTLENIYKEKESLFKKLQPYYALAVVALVCIAGIYMIQKTAVATSNDVKENKNWIQNIIESQTTQRVDDNTVITRRIETNVTNHQGTD